MYFMCMTKEYGILNLSAPNTYHSAITPGYTMSAVVRIKPILEGSYNQYLLYKGVQLAGYIDTDYAVQKKSLNWIYGYDYIRYLIKNYLGHEKQIETRALSYIYSLTIGDKNSLTPDDKKLLNSTGNITSSCYFRTSYWLIVSALLSVISLSLVIMP